MAPPNFDLGEGILLERIGKYLLVEYFFQREMAIEDESVLAEGVSVSIIQPILRGCLEIRRV
jgi:hypothetical protein